MVKNRVIYKMILTFRLALLGGFIFTVLYGMHKFGRDVESYLLIAAVGTAIFTVKCIYHITRFVHLELQPNKQPSEQ